MRVVWCVCVLLVALATEATSKRFGGWGGSRRGGSSPKHRPAPAPAPPPQHSNTHYGGSSGSSSTFLNVERTGSNAPKTTGPIGFERFGSAGSQGNHQIGFDKVNSGVQNKPNSHVPSAPPGPVGPPPAYPGSYPSGHYGATNDHPPAYPGRPINAPPAYSPSNPHTYQQGYPGQQQFGGFGNQYGNHNYGSPQGFGGSPYPGNFPGVGGTTYGGGYHTNNYGGSPFGGGGFGGNPYYNQNNFGYSSNPRYFGGPGQYDNYHKKSRFGGLPIPIPIPIPIPFGGYGGFGGGSMFGGHSYNHRVLDTFIRSSNSTPSKNSSTSVFLLNNSTVTPCTTDHFVYDNVKVTTMACTAQLCTAVKVFTTTNVSAVELVHGASVTLCLEGENVTVTSHGENVTPTLSEVQRESFTVCRNVSSNETTKAVNQTSEAEVTTVVPETTTTKTATPVNMTEVCEKVNCSRVEMCLPALEIVETCPSEPCPFRRKGYKPCITVKMCRSPSAPISTFATLNTTLSKIDEYNNHRSQHDVANITLISYHPPVVPVFNCTGDSGCGTSTTPVPTSSTQTPSPPTT